MLEFKNAKSMELPWVRVGLVGPTGSRKTSTAATFPKPLFFVPYNEGSAVTLRGRDVLYTELGAGGKPVMQPLLGALRALQQLGAQDPAKLHETYGQTVVLDSVSHYQELVIQELQHKGIGGYDLWGRVRDHFLEIRNILWTLPMHVVLTFLDDVKVDDSGNVVERSVLMSGAVKKLLPASVDLLGYCEVIGAGANSPGVGIVAFQPYKGFPGRSRLREVPAGIYQDFSWPVLQRMLQGQG